MFNKIAPIILGSFVYFCFPLAAQAQSFLQFADTYGHVKNSLLVASGRSPETRTKYRNWALTQNPDDVQRETIRLLRASRSAMLQTNYDRACLAYGYLKNARLILVENRAEPYERPVNWCRSTNWQNFQTAMDNEFEMLYKALR